MSSFARFAVAAALVASTHAAFAQQPSLIGTWEWTRRSDGCNEQYVFGEDGVLLVRSGENRTESTFAMAWSPEPNGRYRVTLVTTRDLGGADCAKTKTDKTGQRATGYILFGRSQRTMILCASPQGADCIGPLNKVSP